MCASNYRGAVNRPSVWLGPNRYGDPRCGRTPVRSQPAIVLKFEGNNGCAVRKLNGSLLRHLELDELYALTLHVIRPATSLCCASTTNVTLCSRVVMFVSYR